MKKILSAVLTLLLTATLFIFVTNTTAQVEEADAVVSIPDANLAAAIREELGLPSGAPITSHEMLRLTGLDAPGRGITDLTGLAYAINLTVLILDEAWDDEDDEYLRNPISDLSALATLTQLTGLDLHNTAVSDVAPLANLTQLKTLYLDYTAVSDVTPLANLTQLRLLGLRNTEVSDVAPLANLTQLTQLYLSNTPVSDVAPLANLTQLKTLELNNTEVSDVAPLANLTQLTQLWLNFTAVSDVAPLANLTQLTYLELSSPAVSDVTPLANLTQLRLLWLFETSVSDVAPLANLTQLEALGLTDTAVSDVAPLEKLIQLITLNLDFTAVSDVSPLANLTQLKDLNLYNTSVSDVAPLANLTQLTRLWLKRCPLSYASLHTHIPALQAKGIEVTFDNVAHPALLKISGDRQEGMLGAVLLNPFVVEAMDEHGKPIVGKPVQFEIFEGGGILSAQAVKATVETDARGKAHITLTLGTAAGVNKVKATAEGIESWVLFTAVTTEGAPQLAADVNGDGIVNILDLTAVSGKFGETGENLADVNGDGEVNIQDLVLVAGAFGQEAAAPSARAVSLARLTAADLEQWLREARSASRPGGLSYRRGIVVLEQLLANLIPEETALLANYPNPFNPETWIPYQLATPAEVTVTIYAANGMVVRTLALGHQPAGSYESRSRAAYWDGRNAVGERVASGVYFYTLQAGDFAATRKMLILK